MPNDHHQKGSQSTIATGGDSLDVTSVGSASSDIAGLAAVSVEPPPGTLSSDGERAQLAKLGR